MLDTSINAHFSTIYECEEARNENINVNYWALSQRDTGIWSTYGDDFVLHHAPPPGNPGECRFIGCHTHMVRNETRSKLSQTSEVKRAIKGGGKYAGPRKSAHRSPDFAA